MNTKEEINTGFSLTFQADSDKEGVWGRLICSLLLFFGLGGCLWSVLGLSGAGVSPLLLLLAGCACCVLSCKLPGKWNFAYIGVIVVLGVLVVAAYRFVIEGSGIVMNQIYIAMENYIGRAFPRFFVSEGANQILCATLFLILPTGLLAVLCGRVVGITGGWRYFLLPFAIVLWAVALVFEATLPALCVLAVMIAAISLSASRAVSARRIAPNRRATTWILVLVATLTLIAAIPGLFSINADGSAAAPLRLSTTRKIHAVRYDGEGQTLPEGDFGKLYGFVLSDDPALTIMLEDSGKYYLRGFVGEVYTGDGWTGLSARRRAEYATLFTWLHERGFYAQNQYSLLTSALGIGGQEEHWIQITNDGVSTAYLYAPYELASNRNDASRIGDENLLASGLRGEVAYMLTISEGSVSDDELLYARLVSAINRGESQVVEYLTSESAYREFVYKSYLEVPDAPRAAIEALLATVEFPDGRVSFSDAKMVVNTYLGTLGYTEAPEGGYEGQDALTYFFEESGEGNSIHFATAATLIFRYMGIPARYVEGYLVTPDSETDENGNVILRSKDAYAWAEIYRDGVGFVPFEPEYPAIPPLAPLETMPMESDMNEPPITPPPTVASFLLAVLLGSLTLLLLIIIVLVVRRVIKRRLIKKLFESGGNAELVSRMTTYAVQLLSHMGISHKNGSLYALCPEIEGKLGQELSTEYAEVISIQQAALFSGQLTVDGDRECARKLLKDITVQLKRQVKPIRRFWLGWIQCAF